MKINEATAIYSSKINEIRNRKNELLKTLDEALKANDSIKRDTVELSEELSELEEKYNKLHDFMEKLSERESLLHNAAVSKQQTEAMAKVNEDMIKCLEIARRISNGAKVPPSDERRLMEYDSELYMASKSLAVLSKQKEKKEYDSLWEDEDENQQASADAAEIAGNAEVNMELPDVSLDEASSTAE